MFNKVTIVGVGLLGGSLARDIRAHGLAETIVGVCRSTASAEFALQQGVVDHVQPITDAVVGADLVVFATPMQTMLPLLDQVAPLISEDTVLTDVGSVKASLYDQLKANHSDLLNQFVLAHPIAGGEHSGVQASTLGLFKNKHHIVIDTQETSAQASSKVSELWQAVGAKVIAMSLAEHDAIFAKTSHLPHVIAFSLVNYLTQQNDRERLFDMAAAGFYDFTRIASSDAQMWRDICVTNRDQVLDAIDGFAEQLDNIRNNIEQSNQDDILDYFGAAKIARDAGLVKKNESN